MEKKKKEKIEHGKPEDVNVEKNSEIEDDDQIILKQQLLIDALKEHNQELEEEKEKYKNDYYRAHADAENFKKRKNKEVQDIMKYRIQSFATEVLPVLDNLERALQTEGIDESFMTGIEMIYQQLVAALKNEGIDVRDNLNKPFDPNFDQALFTEKVEGVEPNTVIEVLQKGYVLKDRILRASLVKVSE